MPRALIAPSILTADFGRLAEQARAAEAGGADLWHLDVMDGHFVPPISFGREVIAAVRAASALFIEAHLMVAKPGEQFADMAAAGAQRLVFHYEAVRDLDAAREHLAAVHALGCEAGIAINPETPAEALFPLLDALDEVVVMLIRPGWGGQQMQPALLDKVRTLRARADASGLVLPIEVDGGVKAHNASMCVDAGATLLVAGSATFNREQTPEQALAELRASLEN
ncbi:MAG: ribulose-phosphate 3-epimerase [Dehalococcoidia bacterium]|nr:MAG: ribulose-phosphate 3-epimerase [Dehalococcoidia bacterium]